MAIKEETLFGQRVWSQQGHNKRCNPYGLTRPARSAQSNVQEARPIGMEFYIWVMVRYLSGVNRQ
ncbi:MAG: hypothetical protein WC156_16170, partial [Pedobacter sp.]